MKIRQERELERLARRIAKEKYVEIIGDIDCVSRFKLQKLKKRILKELKEDTEKETGEKVMDKNEETIKNSDEIVLSDIEEEGNGKCRQTY